MTTTAPERRSTPLGDYLQEKRAEAELTQDQLAARVLFTQSAVAQWELGGKVPSARALAALDRELPGADLKKMLALIEEQAS